jgi:hypothetical protein
MFQQVVAYLEAKPVPPSGSMRRADEARAAVAVCLRWGSYFAVLADPARPDAPNIDAGQVSQIDDEEMARMNIEISAGVAWWLTPPPLRSLTASTAGGTTTPPRPYLRARFQSRFTKNLKILARGVLPLRRGTVESSMYCMT